METVPDPQTEKPNDTIIKVTSFAICGSDLHLYEVMAPFMEMGDGNDSRNSPQDLLNRLVRG